jgi:hypothetical protein
MEVHFGRLLESTLVLLVGIEIIQHDVKLAVRKGCNDLAHEAKEFDAPAALFLCSPRTLPVATSASRWKLSHPSPADCDSCSRG